MNAFEKLFKRTKTTVILMGIALLVLGIAMFVSPIGATLLIVQVAGWTLAMVGVVTLLGCWARRALRCWLSVRPSERSSRTEREGRTRSISSLACLASRRYSSRGRRSWTGAASAGSNGSSP